ncbi:hypothetical protein AB0C29_02125 [Actinoplanes sp. NPDC048791]|uniref:hypothetical protein n=1 Tax=Actinoplanes sp. NPDC048791 TaxID=3154623 RepID=UPI0033EF6224
MPLSIGDATRRVWTPRWLWLRLDDASAVQTGWCATYAGSRAGSTSGDVQAFALPL